MNKIEALREALVASTQGDWRVGDAGATVFGPKTDRPSPETIANVRKRETSTFIALAHNLMPTLIEAVDALEAMRCSGGSVEFQANFDWAKSVLEKLKC